MPLREEEILTSWGLNAAVWTKAILKAIKELPHAPCWIWAAVKAGWPTIAPVRALRCSASTP